MPGLADTDGDGLISYQEYLFFLSLLGTPPSHFQIAFQMFDSDRSGVLDLAEFQRMMRTDVMTEIGATHRQGSRERAATSPVRLAWPGVVLRTGARASQGTERVRVGRHLARQALDAPRHLLELGSADARSPRRMRGAQLGKSSGLLVRLFGKDGKGTCSFEDFSSLLRQLQAAVLLLEFNCHDVDENGTIAAEVSVRAYIKWPAVTLHSPPVLTNAPRPCPY